MISKGGSDSGTGNYMYGKVLSCGSGEQHDMNEINLPDVLSTKTGRAEGYRSDTNLGKTMHA